MYKAMYKARKLREANEILVHVTWYEVKCEVKTQTNSQNSYREYFK